MQRPPTNEHSVDDALRLRYYPLLYSLLSDNSDIAWPTDKSDKNLEVLERILEEDNRRFPETSSEFCTDSLRITLARAKYHPSLDDLSRLADSPDLREKLRVCMHESIRHFLDTNISYETLLTCISLDKTEMKHLVLLLKSRIYRFVENGEISVELLINLTAEQRSMLMHELIQTYLSPDIFELRLEPIITVNRIMALTKDEFAIISNPIFKQALIQDTLTIDQVLEIGHHIKTKKDLDAYIEHHITFKKLMDEVLPNINHESREKFRGLSEQAIRRFFGNMPPTSQTGDQANDKETNSRNAENVQAFLALTDQQRAKLVALDKPPQVAALYFRHRALPLERILSFSEDELKFIHEISQNARINAQIIEDLKREGGFDRCYGKHKELEINHAKREAAATKANKADDSEDKFKSLYNKISELENYGKLLAGKKGKNVTSLVSNIREQVKIYEKDRSKVNEISATLTTIINDGNKTMGSDRNFKDIMLHIMFACTGVGLLILTGNKIAHGTFFLNDTKRQKMLKEVRTELQNAMKRD